MTSWSSMMLPLLLLPLLILLLITCFTSRTVSSMTNSNVHNNTNNNTFHINETTTTITSATNNVTKPTPPYYTAFDSASWAITQPILSTILSGGSGGQQQTLYTDFIEKCNTAMGGGENTQCVTQDQIRMNMNTKQPSSVYNYTTMGYKKTRVPTELYQEIKLFFETNKHNAKTEWKDYNVYHNAWESPPTIIHINSSPELQTKIETTIQPILEEWTGQYLMPVSTYGIRLYHNNSILTPHVDRFPLVTSVIIQVDQDLDTTNTDDDEGGWPLEVYGHNGRATNITMAPGDMVLYESHSVIHGRPFPMRGNYFANCFIHYEPYAPKISSSKSKSASNNNNEPEKEDDDDDNDNILIPPYLVPGSAWEKQWKQQNPDGWDTLRSLIRNYRSDDGSSTSTNDMNRVETVANMVGLKGLNQQDKNGWTLLHEAARAGKVKIVQLLLNHGSDSTIQTNYGDTPLDIARQSLPPDHEVIRSLQNYYNYNNNSNSNSDSTSGNSSTATDTTIDVATNDDDIGNDDDGDYEGNVDHDEL